MAATEDAVGALYSAITLQTKAFETGPPANRKPRGFVSWQRPFA